MASKKPTAKQVIKHRPVMPASPKMLAAGVPYRSMKSRRVMKMSPR